MRLLTSEFMSLSLRWRRDAHMASNWEGNPRKVVLKQLKPSGKKEGGLCRTYAELMQNLCNLMHRVSDASQALRVELWIPPQYFWNTHQGNAPSVFVACWIIFEYSSKVASWHRKWRLFARHK